MSPGLVRQALRHRQLLGDRAAIDVVHVGHLHHHRGALRRAVVPPMGAGSDRPREHLDDSQRGLEEAPPVVRAPIPGIDERKLEPFLIEAQRLLVLGREVAEPELGHLLLLLLREKRIHRIRIGHRHLGAHGAAPVRQLLSERGGLLRLRGGQIPLLSGVGREIEELDSAVLEPLDQLPGPRAQGSGGAASLVAVVRIVPVEGAVREAPAGVQERDEAERIHRLAGRRRNARQLEKRRIKIVADDRGIREAPGPDPARDADDQGGAETALVVPSLACAQRQVRRRRALCRAEPPVVRGEDHDGPFRQPQRVEFTKHPVDGLIELLDHAGIDGMILHGAGLEAGPGDNLARARRRQRRGLLAVLPLQIGARLEADVRRMEGEVEEEWPVLRLLDEIRGPDRQLRGKVGVVGRASGGFGVRADDHLESTIGGERPFASQVPLSGDGGSVSRAAERRGQRRLSGGERLEILGRQQQALPVSAEEVRRVQPRGILSGQDARPRGAADIAGGVTLGEPHALGGQAVDRGRFIEGTAATAQVAPAQVVRQQEDDVPSGGRGLLRTGARRDCGERQNREYPSELHRSTLTIDGSHMTRILGTLMALTLAPPLFADDWPQWGGPQRDLVWREKGIVRTLPPGDRLPRVWSTPLGEGYSGPAVAEGRVFITDLVDRKNKSATERALGLDAATGKVLWTYAYPVEY